MIFIFFFGKNFFFSQNKNYFFSGIFRFSQNVTDNFLHNSEVFTNYFYTIYIQRIKKICRRIVECLPLYYAFTVLSSFQNLSYDILYRPRADHDNQTTIESFLSDDSQKIIFIGFTIYKKFSNLFQNQNIIYFIDTIQMLEYFQDKDFHELYIFYSTRDKTKIQSSQHIKQDIKELLNFQQIITYNFNFSPDNFFILDKQRLSKSLHLPFFDSRNNPNGFDYTALIENICPGFLDPEKCCPNCGAATLNVKLPENCCNNIPNIRDHLPPYSAPSEIIDIISNYSHNDCHFIRSLNRFARPILQKTSIKTAEKKYSTLFIQGVSYSLDTRFQFLDPVYIISSNLDLEKYMKKRFTWITSEKFIDIKNLISILLKENETLNQFIHEKMNIFKKDEFLAFVENSYDSRGISISLINTDNPFQKHGTLEALTYNDSKDINISNYRTKSIPADSALYDQLLYPLIFWNGSGGIGKLENENHWDSSEMKYALKAICLQPPNSFIKQCSVLLDEFLCSCYGRLMQIRINKEFNLQLQMRRQDEVQSKNGSNITQKDQFGEKTYIPATLTGSPSYWKNVSKNGFYLSLVLGPPTFFITITENPKWHEIAALNTEKDVMMNSVLLARIFNQKKRALISYIKNSKIFGEVKGILWRDEYQKRGLPHCHVLLWTNFDTTDMHEIDKIITCRLPLPDPFFENETKRKMLYDLSKTFMTHTCTERCRGTDGKCCYGYPKKINQETKVVNERIEFARNPGDENIVPHSPKLLSLFRAHIDVEPVLSTSSIGYVLKYATKNSDEGSVSFHQIKYCGTPVSPHDSLRRYAATHVVSAPEAYNAISGIQRQGMEPTVKLIPIHEEGKRIIYTKKAATDEEIAQKFDESMSKLERYFARPKTAEFSNLLLCEYYSFYMVGNTDDGELDCGHPQFHVKKRKNRIYCAIQMVNLNNHELFALRLLLQEIPAYSFDDLRGDFNTFWEAAAHRGMVENGEEFLTIMNESIELHRPPSDLRNLMVILYEQGSDFEFLLNKYRSYLESDLLNHHISLESAFATMFEARNITIPDFISNELNDFYGNEVEISSVENEIQVNLNEGQKNFIETIIQIIESHKIDNDQPYLVFLQGRAGTGKSFTTNYLIKCLKEKNKHVFVAGTTGIAASQYHDGQTVHSLFALPIDQKIKANEFRSNIGLHTLRCDQILSTDLIIIDEISMMTIKTAIGVDYTLRYLVSEQYGFKGKDIDYNRIPPFGNIPVLFVGDLLQLPPVNPGSHASVAQRLITRCEWWDQVLKFALFQPMRSLNTKWTDFLINIGNGNAGNFTTWKEISNHFGIKITKDFNEAAEFYIDGIDLRNKFPLNIQWICATNFYVDATNDYFFEKRKNIIGSAGKIYAYTKINTELDKKSITQDMDVSEKFQFIQHLKNKDIPDNCLEFQIGEPVCLLRNLNTKYGIVKNKKCWVEKVMSYSVIVAFDDGNTYTIPRIKFNGETNGIHFTRCQVPLRPIFAGTVHKSQGMTLERGVIDLRSNLWEHGQLYVALSRFKDPRNICVLLPDNERAENEEEESNDDIDEQIHPVSDPYIVNMVVEIEENCRKGSHLYISKTLSDDDLSDQSNDSNQDTSITTNQIIIEQLPENLIQKGYIQKDLTQHGLANLGNTCALNSLLQVLSHIYQFNQKITHSVTENMDSNIMTIWKELMLKFNKNCSDESQNSRIIAPVDICALLNIDIPHQTQMDVHELFLLILKQISNYEPLINENLFETAYISTDEEYQEDFDSTYCFVILTENIDPEDTHSLNSLIKVQYPNTNFIKLPLILSFYLNRVIYIDEEHSIKNFVKIFIEDKIEIECDNIRQEYDLFAIIIHIGESANSGHYTSFIKMRDDWFYYNDDNIYKVKEELVQHYSFKSKHKNATMVFYIKHDESQNIRLNQSQIGEYNYNYGEIPNESIKEFMERLKKSRELEIEHPIDTSAIDTTFDTRLTLPNKLSQTEKESTYVPTKFFNTSRFDGRDHKRFKK